MIVDTHLTGDQISDMTPVRSVAWPPKNRQEMPPGHFGSLKFTFDRISPHFRTRDHFMR